MQRTQFSPPPLYFSVNINLEAIDNYLIYLQVIFVAECTPSNSDYMHGKQGLSKGLVPRAFLEIMDE